MTKKPKYQMFGPLSEEEFSLLERDILERGIQIPIEFDQDGNILDGHTRMLIAEKHGLEYPHETRRFKTEDEKHIHVLMINMGRRHLKPHQWGGAFKKLLELRGVRRGSGRQKSRTDTVSVLANEFGVDERAAERRMEQHDAYEKLSEKDRDSVDSEQISISSITRKEKQRKMREDAAKTAKFRGLFSVVLGDPGWKYGATTITGGADQHYAVMTTEEIAVMPIKEHVTENAALFLWVTSPMVQDGLYVLDAWGFEYKTSMVWIKDIPAKGLGSYMTARHELLLIATRGTMIPAPEDRPDSVVEYPAGEHSAKPEVFYEIIEKMYPDQRYLELFARGKNRRKNWEFYGAEIE